MYGFVRQPKWLLAHLLVIALSVAFIGAGIWQFGRHQRRGERNDTVLAQQNTTPVSVSELFRSDADIEFRSIILNGTWVGEESVLIRNRSHREAAGCHLATPLRVDNSLGVLVIAGWLHETLCDPSKFPRPLGNVSMEARIRFTQTRGSLGAKDPASGVLTTLARTDVARINKQTSLELAPVYVELMSSTATPENAIPIDPPSTDLGPHLAYAVQWFLFFAVAAVGYPLVLRRQAKRGESEDLGPIDD